MSSYEPWPRSGLWDEDRSSRRRASRPPDPMTPPLRGSREPSWDEADDEAEEPYQYRRTDPGLWEDLAPGARYRLPRGDVALLWSPPLGARRRIWGWRAPAPYLARPFRGRW
jgi:hypothetical protein